MIKDSFIKKITENVIEKLNKNVNNKYITPLLYVTDDNPISLYLNDFIIKEGLIHSYNPYKLIRYVCKALDIDESVVNMVELNGNIRISYTLPYNENFIKNLNKAMSFGGYHFVHMTPYSLIHGWCVVVYEASHLINIANDVRNNFQYLYHITPLKNIEKIKKIGLKPSSKNNKFKYPKRTHFLIIHPSSALDFVEDLILNKGDSDWMILTIDLSKVNKYVTFHYDTACNIGVYTTDNIQPSAIINIQPLVC